MMDKMEKIVFATLQEQSRHINQTFKELGVSVVAWLEGRNEDVQKAIAKISNHEKQSRKLKDKMLNDVAQAASIYRSDFLRVVLKMEDCSGYQGGAAARLGRLTFVPGADDEMNPKFHQLVDKFIEMGDTLSSLMKVLGENMEKASDFCQRIDLIEEQVDDSYRSLESYLYSRSDLDIRIIMQLREILKHVEESCDMVQSVADSVRIILATH